MGLELGRVLEEPEAAAIAGAVLDLNGMLAWADIGRLSKRKTPIAQDHVSRPNRPIRNYEPTRFELNLRSLGFRRFTVREENQKQLMAEVEHLETAGGHVKFEASLLIGLNIGKSARECRDELLVRHSMRRPEILEKL